ncbi:MAG: methyltransferase domain-containing protein, partial [Candidatus Nitrosopolaris sp.]
TGNNMLNFGYWTDNTQNPMEAQNELCRLVGKFAELDFAKNLADIGSGFSEPAILWKSVHTSLNITCVNINFLQQKVAAELRRLKRSNNIVNSKISQQSLLSSSIIASTITNAIEIISLVNATAKILPFRDKCMDRVIALESAQHFKPLMQFIQESRRILESDGLLVIAIPVIKLSKYCSLLTSTIQEFMKLGILSLMWASEHYELKNIESMINKVGFDIIDIHWIGSHVYEPLANYYTHNRKAIKDIMLKDESSALSSSYLLNISYDLFEKIIYKSALKMKVAYQEGIIDYVLIKARLV